MGFFSEIRKKLEGGQGGWKETLENERKADEQKLREAEERFLKMRDEHEAAKERLLLASRNADEGDAKRISELRGKIEDHE